MITITRVANAILTGIIAGLLAALIVFLANRFLGTTADYGFWGTVTGVLVAILAFFGEYSLTDNFRR